MFAINPIKHFLTPIYQKISRPAALTAAFLASAWIASKVTSDYRIRAALIVGTWFLAKKIQGYVKRNFYKPPVQDPQRNTSYLGLLGADHLNLLACYLDLPLRDQIKNDRTPDAWWQLTLASIYKNPTSEVEESRISRASLALTMKPKLSETTNAGQGTRISFNGYQGPPLYLHVTPGRKTETSNMPFNPHGGRCIRIK